MAPSPAPTTPEGATRRLAMNRSATFSPSLLKTPKSDAATSAEIGATEGVETLYSHPNASVVKFTISASTRPSPVAPTVNARALSPSAGLLPWASPRESTIAAGPLQIYRVPGSVSFLRSGTLLHAIMPRSQCWCVDGVSKFVMRVLPDTYYRIELPGATEEDMQKVEEMKLTLQTVLFYERSACPFLRTFSLDLPEMPDVKSHRKSRAGPAKKWKLDRAFSWKPEDGSRPQSTTSSGEEASSGPPSSTASDEELDEEVTPSKPRHRFEQEADAELGESSVDEKRLEDRRDIEEISRRLMRSATAPASMIAEAKNGRIKTTVDVDNAIGAIESAEAEHRLRSEEEMQRFSTTADRQLRAMPTDMPPSPPDSSGGHDPIYRRPPHDWTEPLSVDQIEVPTDSSVLPVTSVPETVQADERIVDPDSQPLEEIHLTEETKEYIREMVRQEGDELQGAESLNVDLPASRPEPAQLELPSEQPVSRTKSPLDSAKARSSLPNDPYAAIQARIQARRSIGGSPLVHAAAHQTMSRSSTSSASSGGTVSSNRSNASAASASRHQQALATAMVKKACSVFLGPPAHLVVLMLRIAARFAGAAFGVESMFYVATPIGTPRRMPGSFDNSCDEGSDGEDDEDDFGVPLQSPVRLAQGFWADDDFGIASTDGSRRRRLSHKESD